MKNTHKILFNALTLGSIILLSTGCVPKNANGQYNTAYSYHPYHQHATPHKLANSIEQIAKSLLGKKYKYGANGPYAYDCSSFTQHVFAQHAIRIPRVSKDQAMQGQYVNAYQLEKGDLLFFDSKNSKKISHVGIYLGKGNFIHASSSKARVVISNLNSNYYAKHFKWGRRVINQHYARR